MRYQSLALRFASVCLVVWLLVACAAPPASPAAPPSSTPTRALPTATSTPTDTPVPPTPTSTSTSTPLPSPTATDTPLPTATDTPPPPPTNTPRPAATNTPRPPATNTPRPPATSTPVAELQVRFNFQTYDRWGRPDPNDCSKKNNASPVSRLTWDVFVTNNSANTVTVGDWYSPVALNNVGDFVIATCYYQPPDVPPGQTGKATFTEYVEQGQWVSRIAVRIRSSYYVICLNASAQQVACS